MRKVSGTLALMAGLACLVGLLFAGKGLALDNSEIVIIDQQHRATPFGHYDSRRRTRVYGPASGFRYEEYRAPIQPVYPRYRHYYGSRHRPRHGGRVIQHRGPNDYARYGAPAAPRIRGYGHGSADGRGLGRDHRGSNPRQYDNRRPAGARVTEPPQRAIHPSGRVIDNDR